MTTCPSKEVDAVQEYFAYRTNVKTGECAPMTDLSLAKLKVLEQKSGESYLQIAYGQPTEKLCKNGDAEPTAYKLTLNLMCDSEANSTAWLEGGVVDSSDPCNTVITMTHEKACPVFSVSSFSRYFLKNQVILGLMAITFGLVVTVYGRKFFPITIFATGTLAGFAITILLFTMLSMFESAGNQKIHLTALGTLATYLVSAGVGIFVGYILKSILKVGAAIIGAVGGFFISIPLSQILLGWIGSDALLLSVSVLAAIAMAFLSLRHYDNIVIFGTSVLGSYIFVRGISLFLEKGTFPPESEIFERIATGDVSTVFYVLLGLFSMLVGLGVFYQRKQRDEELKANFYKH